MLLSSETQDRKYTYNSKSIRIISLILQDLIYIPWNSLNYHSKHKLVTSVDVVRVPDIKETHTALN